MNAMSEESINPSGSWNFRLQPFQRLCNPLSNLIPLLLFLGVEGLLIFLLISIPHLYYLYVPALALVGCVHWRSSKAEPHEPHRQDERIELGFQNNQLWYGVKGRELKVPLPVKFGSGVLGCRTIIFGPGYALPIPEKIANDPAFAEVASRSPDSP